MMEQSNSHEQILMFNFMNEFLCKIKFSKSMTTRDRTKTYITFRDAFVSRRAPRPSSSSSSSSGGASEGLLAGDSLAMEEGRLNKEPPVWMQFIDEANVDIETVKGKSKILFATIFGC